jgi:hypothetical protein
MPELDFAVLANAGQVSSDNLISILGGGWDTGTLPEGSFPAGIVLTVAFRLLFDEEEAGKPHRGEIVVEHEDGRRLAAVTFTVQVDWAEDIPPGWKSNAPFALPVPAQFPSPGTYGVLISVGGNVLKRIPLLRHTSSAVVAVADHPLPTFIRRGRNRGRCRAALRQRIRVTPGEPGSMWVHGYTRGGHVLKVCVAIDDQKFVITVAWP